MLPINHSLVSRMPVLHYGSIWLVGADDGDPRHLSPLAVHALGTADAVIHDPGISEEILGLVKPPRSREPAAPHQAIERSIKLGVWSRDEMVRVDFEDGWIFRPGITDGLKGSPPS